jgi:uncharacterized damage-inducible protein DinB
METKKWFEREFPTNVPVWLFSSILERLRGTPARLEERVAAIPSHFLTVKLRQQWSIQQNIGHLLDLEPLWHGRIGDILAGAAQLRPTDLANRATDLADHNAKAIGLVLSDFRAARMALITTLEALDQADFGKTALHPRLKTPMGIVEKMLFVADHDDHHLAQITALLRALQAAPTT